MFRLLRLLLYCILPKVSYIHNVGDIPAGIWRSETLSHASIASNGQATVGVGTDAQRWRAPQNGVIIGANWEPTGANATGANGTSFRTIKLYNASASNAGTIVLGSVVLSVSLASNNTRALTMNATASNLVVSTGDIIAASTVTAGGAETNHTSTVAGIIHIHWRPKN